MQRVAFLTRAELYDALRFHVLDQPLQYRASKPGTGHFAATEEDSCFYLVAFVQKAQHVILFRFVIVIVHINAELDLFYRDRFLVLLGLALFLFLLVQIFPVVHDAADREVEQ